MIIVYDIDIFKLCSKVYTLIVKVKNLVLNSSQKKKQLTKKLSLDFQFLIIESRKL